jgi:hypothetical protein
MPRVLDPFRFVLTAIGGWMNQHQLQIMPRSIGPGSNLS